MIPTLFHVPNEFVQSGWLLAIWGFVSLAILISLVWRQGFNADTWGHAAILAVIAAVIYAVVPKICDDQGLPIRGYGVMFLLAVLAGTVLAAWRARRRGIDPEMAVTMAFWMCIPGFIGARLFYVIEYWQGFQGSSFSETCRAAINVTEGGLVVYGAYVGAVLGLLAFICKYKLPALAWFDLVAPSMVLGLAFGRIGCLLNGCCYGGACDLPWAVTFPWGSPVHRHQAQSGKTYLHGLKIIGNWDAPPLITEVQADSPAQLNGLQVGDRVVAIDWRPAGKHSDYSLSIQSVRDAQWKLLDLDQPGTQITIATDRGRASWTIAGPMPRSNGVHPTQLYSSIHAFLLCLFLVAYEPFRRRDGEVTAVLMTIYPVTRFLLEIIRQDESPVFDTGMSISQNVSLAILLVACGLWFYILRRPPGTALPRHDSPLENIN